MICDSYKWFCLREVYLDIMLAIINMDLTSRLPPQWGNRCIFLSLRLVSSAPRDDHIQIRIRSFEEMVEDDLNLVNCQKEGLFAKSQAKIEAPVIY